MDARKVFIHKNTEQNSQQGRRGHSPANQAERPKTEPNALYAPALCPEFSDFERANLPAESSFAAFGFRIGVFRHDEIPQSDGLFRFLIVPWPNGHPSPDHPGSKTPVPRLGAIGRGQRRRSRDGQKSAPWRLSSPTRPRPLRRRPRQLFLWHSSGYPAPMLRRSRADAVECPANPVGFPPRYDSHSRTRQRYWKAEGS